jgi:hypothetical protein
MPRPRKKDAPKKLWIVVDAEGLPVGTPLGTLFLSQDEGESGAKSVGKSKHAVKSYSLNIPKPRGSNVSPLMTKKVFRGP